MARLTAVSTSTRTALLVCMIGAVDLAAQSPDELVRDLAGPRAEEAEAELQRLGPEAVDALIDAGHLDSEDVRIRSLRLLTRLGLRAGDIAERILSAYAKGPCEPEEFVALLDALGATLPNSERLRRERLAMGKPGEWLMPGSVRELVRSVRCKGRPTEDLLPRLRLAQGRMEVRSFFLIGPDSTTEELVAELENELPLVRELAAELLGLRGAAATGTVPALAAALRGSHVREGVSLSDCTGVVHEAAARAILDIDPEHAESALAHAWMLRNGTEDERLEAVVALAILGADAAEAVPALIEVLDSAESEARLQAIVALGGIGPAAAAALPRLRELAKSDVEQVARRSAAAVRSIDRD